MYPKRSNTSHLHTSPTHGPPELAASVGIFFTDPVGLVSVRNGWLTVGSVIVFRGGIEIVPRLWVTETHKRRLLSAATQVWLFGPDLTRGVWTPHGELGWVAGFAVGYHSPGGGVFRRVAASEPMCFADSRSQRFSLGLSAPSGV